MEKKEKVAKPIAKPIFVVGQRVLVRAENIYEKEDGKEMWKGVKPSGKVLVSNVEEVKKGDTVYFTPFSGVEIADMSDKKYRVLVLDIEDVYARV
jgi:hypothetical protein